MKQTVMHVIIQVTKRLVWYVVPLQCMYKKLPMIHKMKKMKVRMRVGMMIIRMLEKVKMMKMKVILKQRR